MVHHQYALQFTSIPKHKHCSEELMHRLNCCLREINLRENAMEMNREGKSSTRKKVNIDLARHFIDHLISCRALEQTAHVSTSLKWYIKCNTIWRKMYIVDSWLVLELQRTSRGNTRNSEELQNYNRVTLRSSEELFYRYRTLYTFCCG